jgi:hypothetical protein
MTDDDLTPTELATLRDGLERLATVDAHMALLIQTLSTYPDQPRVATGIFSKILGDAANVAIAWQALRATPFGDLLDPRVTGDGS